MIEVGSVLSLKDADDRVKHVFYVVSSKQVTRAINFEGGTREYTDVTLTECAEDKAIVVKHATIGTSLWIGNVEHPQHDVISCFLWDINAIKFTCYTNFDVISPCGVKERAGDPT